MTDAELTRTIIGAAIDVHRTLGPGLLEAVKAYATLGEICDTLRQPFGVYNEVAIT